MTTTSPRITFLGATDTVTGSRYLVEHDGRRILVDCGLFQGPKKLRQRNWQPPGFDVASLDAVILTHAHLDHTGYVPKLCKLGYHGRIYCTEGTRDLLKILLPDSGHLQEEEARLANRGSYSRHHPVFPLYTRADAEECLDQLSAVEFGVEFSPVPGVTAAYTRAGHIVGAGCLRLQLGPTSITFSGDVGRPNDPVMKPPEPLRPTDYLVVESTCNVRIDPDFDESARSVRTRNAPVAASCARVVTERVTSDDCRRSEPWRSVTRFSRATFTMSCNGCGRDVSVSPDAGWAAAGLAAAQSMPGATIGPEIEAIELGLFTAF